MLKESFKFVRGPSIIHHIQGWFRVKGPSCQKTVNKLFVSKPRSLRYLSHWHQRLWGLLRWLCGAGVVLHGALFSTVSSTVTWLTWFHDELLSRWGGKHVCFVSLNIQKHLSRCLFGSLPFACNQAIHVIRWSKLLSLLPTPIQRSKK